MSDNRVILKVKDVEHILRSGTVVLGSMKNERYATIIINDKSICSKHACIRYDPLSANLQLMDLCSMSGVRVDRRPIESLTWCKINTLSQILIGTVPVSVEGNLSVTTKDDGGGAVAKKEDLSYLLDEDSNDFIDCSLEEAELLPPGRKGVKSSSGLSNVPERRDTSAAKNITLCSALAADKPAERESSFFVPATQQLEDSAISSAGNISLPAGGHPGIPAKSVPEKSAAAPPAMVVAETEQLGYNIDDDEDFFIPETQQPADDESDRQCPSPIIGIIAPGPIGSNRVERTHAEEDYFQMTVQDAENSNDGLFNNLYVEGSQNLLKNMDESYNQEEGVAKTRVSILPERSVDSISFQEHRNTTQDMSRLEWNETRQEESNQSARGKVTVVEKNPSKLAPSSLEEDERSVTPELNFDEPAKENRERDGDGSVTPEVDFDNILLHVANDAPAASRPPASAWTLMSREEEEHENDISLNQEGCAEKRDGNDGENNDGPVQSAMDADDIETQALDFDCEEDADTKNSTAMNAAGTSGENSKTALCVYDMETQALNFDDVAKDPYDMSTQPIDAKQRCSSMGPPKTPLVCKPNRVSRFSKQPPTEAAIDPADIPTQPMEPPESLRGLYATAINPAEMLTQPMSPPGGYDRDPNASTIDPADMLTQPMSPPKYLMEDDVWGKPPANAYDQPTQPLELLERSHGSCMTTKARKTAGNSLKKPFVQLVDIQRARTPLECSDPYAMQTQPMSVEESCRPPPPSTSTSFANISQFDPQINSTVRHSLLRTGPGDELKRGEKEHEISPSSNKENRTGCDVYAVLSSTSESEAENEEENLDEDVCLSATLPVGEKLQSNQCASMSVRVNREPGKLSSSVFKPPTTTAKVNELVSSPKPFKRGKHREVETMEFLTPEHPLLTLPKADSFLKAGKLSASLAVKRNFKYHFNESSSSSDDEGESKFKKTNVSVALERESEELRRVSQKQKKPLDKKGRKVVDRENDSDGAQNGGISATTGSATRKHQANVDVKLLSSDVSNDDGPKRRKKEPDEKSSSSSSGRRSNEPASGSEPARKSSSKDKERTKKDDGKRSELLHRGKEKEISKPSSTKQQHDGKSSVSSRTLREVRSKPPIDESVDYQSKTSDRTRRPKETRAASEREYGKPSTRMDDGPEAPPRRESKRQKAATYKRRSLSPQGPVSKKKPVSERTTRQTTATASTKVDDGKSSLNAFSKLTGEEERLSPAGRNGGHVVGDVVPASSTDSDGSSRSVRATRPKLIFTRMSPDPHRQSVARVGGKIVDYPELANVLVTDRIYRSYKFLCAAAKGIPIVGQSYLDALQSTNGRVAVDPWQHLLHDEASEARYQFCLRDTLLRAKSHKLFQDYTVFVTSSTRPPPSELYLILSCAGATVIKNPSQSVKPRGKMFVISDPSDAASWPKYRDKYPSIEIVSSEGFMMCIIKHSVQLKNYRLT